MRRKERRRRRSEDDAYEYDSNDYIDMIMIRIVVGRLGLCEGCEDDI